jgi:hypothetical protein
VTSTIDTVQADGTSTSLMVAPMMAGQFPRRGARPTTW